MGCTSSQEEIYDPDSFRENCAHDTLEEISVTFSNQSKRNFLQWEPNHKDKSRIIGVVLICHGLHEHGMVFDTLAHELTAQNFVCSAYDQHGHGKSCENAKDRGFVTSHALLIDDFVEFAQYACRDYPNLPVHIVCHSLGTSVVLSSLGKEDTRKRLPPISSVVFMNCAIYPGFASASPFGFQFLHPITKTSAAVAVTKVTSSLDPRGPAG